MTKPKFREQVLRAREDAIVDAVNRLLATKGYDLMTVDEVAAEVGIAKASLYKHFASKEALAAEAMTRVLKRALAYMDGLQNHGSGEPIEQLRAVVRWTIEVQLAGEMPSLPAQNSVLRDTLLQHQPYIDTLVAVSERLGTWILAGQAERQIDPELPAQVVLYTLFARACDPVLAMLRASGLYSPEQMTAWMLRSCFHGLRGPAGQAIT